MKASRVCDYSLLAVPNRLAANGEELVVHRFQEGSVGMASAFDLRLSQQLRRCKFQGFWPKLKEWFKPTSDGVPAVCIPPGSRLLIRDIPELMQREWGVHSSIEEAVFAQITAQEKTYRDAVCFSNGTAVLLQKLVEGQRVRVLSVSSGEEQQMEPESGLAMRIA